MLVGKMNLMIQSGKRQSAGYVFHQRMNFRIFPVRCLRAFLFILNGTLLACVSHAENLVENLSAFHLRGALADLGDASEAWMLPLDSGPVVMVDEQGNRSPAVVAEGRLFGVISVKAASAVRYRADVADDDESDASLSRIHRSATMTNGLLRWTMEPDAHGAPRWRLSLGAGENPLPADILLEHMRYRGFVDAEPRGRLRRAEYEAMDDAVDVEKLAVRRIEIVRGEDATTVRISRLAPPRFPELDFVEEFTLRRGVPLLEYRMRPVNNGDEPIYLAYVFWEGDLHGRYGPALAGAKLLESPYPSAPLRLVTRSSQIENGLTRWGRGWGAERAWVGYLGLDGTGFGLGVTTPRPLTERHYYGSSIWLASTWQVHFDLTETVAGYYPVRLQPGGVPVELGLDLLISQGGVRPGNPARGWLHSAGDPARDAQLRERLSDWLPVAVTGPDAVSVKPIPAMAAASRIADARVWRLASAGDEPAHFVIGGQTATAAEASVSALAAPRRLAITTVAEETFLPLVVEAVQGEQVLLLGKVTEPGVMEWVLNPEKKLFREPWRLRIRSAGSSGRTSVSLVEFAEPRPAPPPLQSPRPDQSVTDIATFFRWEKADGAFAYELEIGPAGQSADSRREVIESLLDLPHYMPLELPAPGRYFWRVRSLLVDGTPGEWSPTRYYTINNEHSTAPIVRPIGPLNPLITMEAHGASSMVPFNEAIPPDLRPYTAIVSWHTQYFSQIGQSLFDFFSEPARHGEPLTSVVRFGHGQMANVYVSLSELEALFQECPWVIGVIGTESFEAIYGTNPYVRRLIQLCAKYGRWFIEGDGNYTENKLHRLASDPETAALVRRYSDYVILSQKNNIHYLQYLNQSSLMGMWLSGMIGQTGSWEDGGWYWEQVGFRGLGERRGVRSGDLLHMPVVFWNLTFLHGLSQGATVFHIDGQVATKKSAGHRNQQAADFDFSRLRHAVWTTEGKTLPAYDHVIAPFFRAIIQQRLIPDKAKVIDGLRLAVRQDQPWREEHFNDGAFYAHYTPLYQETYGFYDEPTSETYEYFPNTGRFGYFPILPLHAPPLLRSDGSSVPELTVSSLDNRAAVRNAFHSAYPDVDHGNALVILHPDRFFVQNTNENKDITQFARVPLGETGVTELRVNIEPHMYVIGRRLPNASGIWLQTHCEYPDRPLRFEFHCDHKPEYSVNPASAVHSQSWNPGVLILEMRAGELPVEIEIIISAEIPAAQLSR